MQLMFFYAFVKEKYFIIIFKMLNANWMKIG